MLNRRHFGAGAPGSALVKPAEGAYSFAQGKQQRSPAMSDASDKSPRSASEPGRFTQGESYGGARSDGRTAGGPTEPDASRRAGMKGVYAAGFAMIGVTVLMLLLGAAGWVAALAGLATFVVGATMARRSAEAAKGRRTVKAAAGVDIEKAQADLDAAEADLAAIDRVARRLSDRGLEMHLRDMTKAARGVLDQIAEDPGDLRRSIKFLKVYIPSARAAVEKFSVLGVRDNALDDRFRALVREMKDMAERQAETLRLDDKMDLEVEIEVLAERLKS